MRANTDRLALDTHEVILVLLSGREGETVEVRKGNADVLGLSSVIGSPVPVYAMSVNELGGIGTKRTHMATLLGGETEENCQQEHFVAWRPAAVGTH